MTNPVFKFSYVLNGKSINDYGTENGNFKIDYEFDDSVLKAVLTAKKNLKLTKFEIMFSHTYKADDKFFSNGYQAWTTSREYSKSDKQPGLTPFAVGGLKKIPGCMTDYLFAEQPKVSGEFYSHTYSYIKNGDDFFLIGSLSEKKGFTLIRADMNRNSITISKDIEGVSLKEGESYEMFDIVFFKGGYDEVFDKYFDSMKLGAPRIDHMSGYTSWYNYFQNINEEIILRDLNALDAVHDSVSIFQVDDGYETHVGDWLDPNPEKFPHGMKYIAQEIHKKGYMAGIWVAPFSVEKKSRILKEHPDWVLKDEKGKPEQGVIAWGGAYTLDIYNPEAREYIKTVLKTITEEWGFDMLKLDFLYSQCIHPRNGKSRGTIMCESMAFLRECCGDKLILGCGVHLGACFGYVDACRVSCDVDLKYSGKIFNKFSNEAPCAQNAMISTIFRRHLDGRAFCNDPDVFFFRDTNLQFTDEQKNLLAQVNNICGNVLFVSDNVSEYREEYLNLLPRIFKKTNIEVISADFVDKNIIIMNLKQNGRRQMLRFNIKTGKNNLKMKADQGGQNNA